MGATPKPSQPGFTYSLKSDRPSRRTTASSPRGLARSTAVWLLLFAGGWILLHYTLYDRNRQDERSGAALEAVAAPTLLEPTATSSCEVCHLDPTNPLCRYGLDNIRMSRAYEASGHRLRKVLRRALDGEKIGVGILGASVTLGHGVPPGGQRWEDRWFEDFQKAFPTAEMHVGAAPAMDSQFFACCASAVVPMDLDIYIVELDINNDGSFNTMKSDDALMRGLMQLPQEPAVLRVSVFALVLEDLLRGTASTLMTSQLFDVPVISLRPFMLPHVIRHREASDDMFSKDPAGNIDLRHISELSHTILGDMLSLYTQKEICETRRRELFSELETARGPWIQPTELGMVPNATLWDSWMTPKPPRIVMPLCQSLASQLSPLTPISHSKAFKIETWHDKSAWAAAVPGAQIRLRFTGSWVGLFVYVTNGDSPVERSSDPIVRRTSAPGQATCWIEDPTADLYDEEDEGGEEEPPVDPEKKTGDDAIFIVNSHFPNREAAGFEFIELSDSLSTGEHILACEVSKETTSGGYKWRVQGIASL
ncbi:hypothetical protein JCM10908_005887 [Rhodotorula pacifica]|uniref:uncharacterized protein n=1 Tax=Rhodotorula pacifica TaxID=1495444 RepID=UPI0031750D5C